MEAFVVLLIIVGVFFFIFYKDSERKSDIISAQIANEFIQKEQSLMDSLRSLNKQLDFFEKLILESRIDQKDFFLEKIDFLKKEISFHNSKEFKDSFNKIKLISNKNLKNYEGSINDKTEVNFFREDDYFNSLL